MIISATLQTLLKEMHLADMVQRNLPGGSFKQENNNEIQISLLLYCIVYPNPN
jgi:hypothetical protein